jgi:alpha-glucosidase
MTRKILVGNGRRRGGGRPPRSSWVGAAVIYEVYVRSFADGNGDGMGDLVGIASRLDYLADLGVDALWLTPFYRSPMADGGYDVADYRAVDPTFGTLADFDRLLADSHERGIKVIVDLVPNHCSDQHPWFKAAVAAGPDSPERERFHFRQGSGDQPPNNWPSIFGGSAWTRLPDGDWYLHLFAPEQPDLNWDHPDVRAEFASVLRFWLDRGVDGIRVDVAHGLVKAPGLPDAATTSGEILAGDETPYFDQDAVHHIFRDWRSILDSYVPERVAVAEAWLPNRRTVRYVRADELHQAFNFEFLFTPWSAREYRRVIDESLELMASVGASPTWVMSNHDVVRHASRLAGPIAGGFGSAGQDDAVTGLRRARAATLLMLALPGSAYLYQGEELGLPEVFDLPAEARQDPRFARSDGAVPGRDGCRVPIPWSGSQPPYGFGPDGSLPWLPQPESWAELSVAAQQGEPASTLMLYLRALRLRRERDALGAGELRWLSGPDDDLLVFQRPGRDAVLCAVNQGKEPAHVAHAVTEDGPLVASGPLTDDGLLPPGTAAWWAIRG